MAASITTSKKELRKKIKSILSRLPEAAAATQSFNATKAVLSMPEYKAANRISVYLSMPSGEISTSGIVHDALKQGKRVFIPYTYKLTSPKEGQPKSIMDMLELQSVGDYESLKPDKWDIPTPNEDSISSRANCFGGMGITQGETTPSEECLDLIIMPGMAFDCHLGRLGHGKGFYDYFLSRCHAISQLPFRANSRVVALALTEQILPINQDIPMDVRDYCLDAIALGSGDILRRNVHLDSEK
ncbi:nagb/rpia/CoA transferase-like protein [Lojkania enalia]|uniref:5-formyltetrahydrofolate cyclo-ligase n=1 Tax=Lojkania enalia TaxID=147567 RepID=A0A9P4K2J2_9PLEO|nr:nagb/rpia/CoA transferase-like protein [Didymosphaeria enalia]